MQQGGRSTVVTRRPEGREIGGLGRGRHGAQVIQAISVAGIERVFVGVRTSMEASMGTDQAATYGAAPVPLSPRPWCVHGAGRWTGLVHPTAEIMIKASPGGAADGGSDQ